MFQTHWSLESCYFPTTYVIYNIDETIVETPIIIASSFFEKTFVLALTNFILELLT